MGAVKESTKFGLHCGKIWTALLISLSVIYLLVCLAATLITRIYIQGLYR